MGGEPWCFAPHQIALLTDYQIIHLYVLPAVQRAREMELRGKGMDPDAAHASVREEAVIPPRETMVAMLTQLGLSPADADREYDRQLAETLRMWEEQDASAGGTTGGAGPGGR